MSVREIRQRAGKSQIWVAVNAGCSEPTVRLYEANPKAVSPLKREKLDLVYRELLHSIEPVGTPVKDYKPLTNGVIGKCQV